MLKQHGIGKNSRRERGTEIKFLHNKIFLMTAVVLIFSCSPEKSADSDPVLDIIQIGNCTTEKDAEKYYSADTIKAAHKLSDKFSDSDVLLGLDAKIFIKGMKYELVKTSVKKNKCRTEFLITAHPDMNFIGMKISILLINEDGAWKIDREKELKSQL